MPVKDLFALGRQKATTPNLQARICELCDTKVEFNPLEPGDFEYARDQIQRHRCRKSVASRLASKTQLLPYMEALVCQIILPCPAKSRGVPSRGGVAILEESKS
jgi:hypothetical protein